MGKQGGHSLVYSTERCGAGDFSENERQVKFHKNANFTDTVLTNN